MRQLISSAWIFIFDHERSPLRHIPDFGVRCMIFQMLGWMWALSFSLAIGSYTFMAVSMIGHIILVSAIAITAATYTAATKRPQAFLAIARR
jgi:hypothetical protein